MKNDMLVFITRRNNECLGDGSYFYHVKQILDKYEEESDSKADDDKNSK